MARKRLWRRYRHRPKKMLKHHQPRKKNVSGFHVATSNNRTPFTLLRWVNVRRFLVFFFACGHYSGLGRSGRSSLLRGGVRWRGGAALDVAALSVLCHFGFLWQTLGSRRLFCGNPLCNNGGWIRKLWPCSASREACTHTNSKQLIKKSSLEAVSGNRIVFFFNNSAKKQVVTRRKKLKSTHLKWWSPSQSHVGI